ncbi:MAG: hypothetical protein JRI54_06245, partial [Deltaproteobacteria bacterium]|nr:hypothetical protein [Deltaproteobacteria bacterium]
AEREVRKRAEAEARQRLYRLKTPLLEEMNQLEKRLDELGNRLDEISAQLAIPETYQDQERSRVLLQEYTRLKTESEGLMKNWEAVALKLEELEERLDETDELR